MIVEFLLRARIHVQMCALAAAWAWSHFLGANLSTWQLLVVPLVVAAVYNWNRLTDTEEDRVNCAADIPRSKTSAFFLALVCAICAALSLMLASGTKSLLLIAGLMMLGIVYSGVKVAKVTFRLKRILFVKNLSSALGWSVISVLYPSLFMRYANAGRTITAFTCMVLSVLIVEISWDVRDLQGDRKAGVHTIPVEFGFEAAKRIVFLADCALCLVILIGMFEGYFPLVWLWALINAAVIFLAATILLDFFRWQRFWSHLLVVAQTVMLLTVGLLTRPAAI